MKKTLITAFLAVAACSTAFSDVVSIDNILSNADDWDAKAGISGRSTFTIRDGLATLVYPSSGSDRWAQSYASYTATQWTLGATNKDDSINFSVTITVTDPANPIDNTAFVAMGSETQTIVFGTPFYKAVDTYNSMSAAVTVTTDGTSTIYGANSNDAANAYTLLKNGDNVLVAGSGDTVTYNGAIAWGSLDGKEQYVATISSGDYTASVGLGDSFTLKRTLIGFNAGNGGGMKVENFKLEIVPEPATATLSLLALAGLAARRRRK